MLNMDIFYDLQIKDNDTTFKMHSSILSTNITLVL